jgi:hypothetical protein
MRAGLSGAWGGQGRALVALCALYALLCAGCATAPADAHLGDVPAPTPTQAQARAGATPTAAPPLPTAVEPAATATPQAPATPTPAAPARVGIQIGHWKIEEHADEMARLRKFSGAYYGGFDEWEVNMVIGEAVRERLEAAGVTVDLLPSRIPIGYEADAFISIHIDGVTGEEAATRRGWKVATPFRASQASRGLAAAIETTYPAVTGLPLDAEEASFNLRAYYAFAYYRYWHSIAPTTPAAIIECAFMTHPADRELIFDRPEVIAEGIAQGVLEYLDAYYPLSAEERAPVGRGLLRPAAADVPLRERPSEGSDAQRLIGADERLAPMLEEDGWLLVFAVGGEWDLGWVKATEVAETGEGLAPPHPRPEE